MTVPPSVADNVRELLQRRSAYPISPEDLRSEIPVGGDGLGLDSIAIAEVLLECEERFGIDPLPLLDLQPLTVRALVAHFESPVR